MWFNNSMRWLKIMRVQGLARAGEESAGKALALFEFSGPARVAQASIGRLLALCMMVFFQSFGLSQAQTLPTAAVQPPSAKNSIGAQPARQWITPGVGDVQQGAAIYQTLCTTCHAIDSNKIGPAHRGVMGRRVGSLAGYKYSNEVASSRLRWTPQTLNAWLEDPEELVPGQRMGFQVDSAQDRADLIAYLSTLK